MRRVKMAGIVLLAALLLTVLAGCGEKSRDCVMLNIPQDPYRQVLTAALPRHHVRELGSSENQLAALRNGGALEQFDFQASTALAQGVGTYWYPQALATVVLAVDRDRTDAPVRGWQDVVDQGLRLSLGGNKEPWDQLVMTALSRGLEGERITGKPALRYLADLQSRGLLQWRDNGTAQVLACLDFQAVQLIGQGRRLEIVVPREGTMSYELGLLSDQALTTPEDEALLEAGFRLQDGRCTASAYPPREAYASAFRLPEDQHIQGAMRNIHRSILRQVMHERWFSSADGREHVIVAVLGMAAALFWMGAAVRRSIRPEISGAIRLVGVQVVLWLGTRLVKYMIGNSTLVNRYLWYCFYIFQLGLPLTLLYLASVIDRPEAHGRPPRWMQVILGLYPLFLLLVLTNDLHFLVFRMDLRNYSDDMYTYGPGYYGVYAYCFLTFLMALVLLIVKSRKSPRRGAWVLPVLVSAAILTYTISYVLGLTWSRKSDYTMTFCALAVLLLDSALRTGLVPANTRYGELFALSPLDMQLLDREGTPVLTGKNAAALEPDLRARLCSEERVTMLRDPDTQLFGRAVRGGTAVWQEDLSAVNALHREIRESVLRLQASHTMLQHERAIRSRQLDSAARLALLSSLDQEIQEDTEELAEFIESLPGQADRERRTAYIALLLCHIKRRCNLFFVAREGREMAGDDLAMYLDELGEFGQYAGISVLNHCRLTRPVDAARAALCYDFAFAVLSWSVRESRATLLCQLEEQEGGLEFRVLSSERVDALEFSTTFLEHVEKQGGRLQRRELDEDTGLYLILPKGGGGHA